MPADCSGRVPQHNLDLPQLLLPVPMTRKTIRRRGFNHAAYIARLVGRQLKIKVGFDVVRKTRETHRQPALSGSRRQQNIADGFGLSRSLTGKQVAIIDDVVTSCRTGYGTQSSLSKRGERVGLYAYAGLGISQ